MREKLLHYIWASKRYCGKQALYTTEGKKLEVIHTGIPNQYGGPDIDQAHIRIDGIDFYGSIEIHPKSSSWQQHGHAQDSAYANIILHVVWEDDQPVKTANRLVPTVELCHFVDHNLLLRYQQLMQSQSPILCKGHLTKLPIIPHWQKTVELYAQKRLQRKQEHIINLWKANQKDSDATAYQLLTEHFGFKANNQAFLALSQQVPIHVIQANSHHISFIEALLLGQAGFLHPQNSSSSYPQKLLILYQKLHKKYKLQPPMSSDQWRFCQLRPPNFPTIRIAQLAKVLTLYPAVFHFLLNIHTQDMYSKLTIRQSPYWQSHYFANKASQSPIPGLGRSSIHSIVINTVVPLLFVCGYIRYDNFYIDRAIQILSSLPPENNAITRQWKQQGIQFKNALETQGAMELFQQLCTPKKCAECPIGRAIIS